jgi:hypothetical protein
MKGIFMKSTMFANEAETAQSSLRRKVAKALLDQWLADDRSMVGANLSDAALRTVATHLGVSLDVLESRKVTLISTRKSRTNTKS